jgi:hypothetical protein
VTFVVKEIPLSNALPKRPESYYCADELDECIEDCKIAGGELLENE